MEIILLTVGKTNSSYIISGIDDYCRRLKHYVPFRITSIPDPKNVKSLTSAQRRETEGSLILQNLESSDLCVLLDERGKEYSSMEFASYLEKAMASGKKRIVFVVGGPYGFSESVYRRGDSKISLSRMTFSHEMVRLFFTEQIYRAMTILRNEPYHHE